MSDIELEGKITQVHERLPHTTQKGKESTKQLIVLSVKGVLTKIFCYGIDDLSPYRDTLVRISGLSESFKKDGSYMANFKTEFDDRVDSEVGEEQLDITEKLPIPEDKSVLNGTWTKQGSDVSYQENKTYRVLVARVANYQKVELETTITGTLADISKECDLLNKLAYDKLQGMLE